MKEFIIIEKVNFDFEVRRNNISTYNKFRELQSYNNMPAIEITSEDTLFWAEDGKLHSFNDMPSAIRALNTFLFSRSQIFAHLQWSKNGITHRENDKPAIILNNGAKGWYNNGKLSREDDKPAFISNIDNLKIWAVDGLIFRKENKPNFIIDNNEFYLEINPYSGNYTIKNYNINKKKENSKLLFFMLNNALYISLIISLIIIIFQYI